MSEPTRPLLAEHSARRHLDELEALMERMLALPVDPLEESTAVGEGVAPPIPPSESSDLVEHAPPLTSSAFVSLGQLKPIDPEPPSSEPPAKPSLGPVLSSPPVSMRPALAVGSQEGVGVRSSAFVLAPVLAKSEDLPPASVKSQSLEDRLSVSPPPPRVQSKPVSRGLLPLIAVNALFDAATCWMGAPGRWLRGPTGRGILGWTGVLLFLATAIWVAADKLGWSW